MSHLGLSFGNASPLLSSVSIPGIGNSFGSGRYGPGQPSELGSKSYDLFGSDDPQDEENIGRITMVLPRRRAASQLENEHSGGQDQLTFLRSDVSNFGGDTIDFPGRVGIPEHTTVSHLNYKLMTDPVLRARVAGRDSDALRKLYGFFGTQLGPTPAIGEHSQCHVWKRTLIPDIWSGEQGHPVRDCQWLWLRCVKKKMTDDAPRKRGSAAVVSNKSSNDYFWKAQERVVYPDDEKKEEKKEGKGEEKRGGGPVDNTLGKLRPPTRIVSVPGGFNSGLLTMSEITTTPSTMNLGYVFSELKTKTPDIKARMAKLLSTPASYDAKPAASSSIAAGMKRARDVGFSTASSIKAHAMSIDNGEYWCYVPYVTEYGMMPPRDSYLTGAFIGHVVFVGSVHRVARGAIHEHARNRKNARAALYPVSENTDAATASVQLPVLEVQLRV